MTFRDTVMADIRTLLPDDNFQDLIALSQAFFEEYATHHRDFFAIEQEVKAEEITGYFRSFVEKDNHAVFVALLDGRIVGYITLYVQMQPTYWKVKKVGHISGLMVHKDIRHEGIGGRLMDQARAYFAEQGIEYYLVYTAIQNNGAIKFYEEQGMEPLYSHLMGKLNGWVSAEAILGRVTPGVDPEPRPDVPALLEQLKALYRQIVESEEIPANNALRLLTVASDMQWYAGRIGEERWDEMPRSNRWSFHQNLWRLVRWTREAMAPSPKPIHDFIDEGKKCVGQAAEILALFEKDPVNVDRGE